VSSLLDWLNQRTSNNTAANSLGQQQAGVKAPQVLDTWDNNIPSDELTYIGTVDRPVSRLQQAIFDPNRRSNRGFHIAFCQRCMFL
jgi:hypothetical protein